MDQHFCQYCRKDVVTTYTEHPQTRSSVQTIQKTVILRIWYCTTCKAAVHSEEVPLPHHSPETR